MRPAGTHGSFGSFRLAKEGNKSLSMASRRETSESLLLLFVLTRTQVINNNSTEFTEVSPPYIKEFVSHQDEWSSSRHIPGSPQVGYILFPFEGLFHTAGRGLALLFYNIFTIPQKTEVCENQQVLYYRANHTVQWESDGESNCPTFVYHNRGGSYLKIATGIPIWKHIWVIWIYKRVGLKPTAFSKKEGSLSSKSFWIIPCNPITEILHLHIDVWVKTEGLRKLL